MISPEQQRRNRRSIAHQDVQAAEPVALLNVFTLHSAIDQRISVSHQDTTETMTG
jgi:hypothetical protein